MNPVLSPLKPIILTLSAALVLAACGGNNGSESARTASASGAGSAHNSGSTVDCAGGDPANADDPCLINTIDQLQALAATGHYALAADIDAGNTRDWNDGAGFRPLAPFSGSLDGRGFTISGLTINRADDADIGLFSQLADEAAIVRDLRLNNAQVTGDRFVGVLAGRVRAGQVHGVHVDGSVTAGEWAGGLIGSLHDGALVSHSSSRGQVQGDGERVGGLVGQNDGDISHSFSLAAVRGRTSVGGLVGRGAGRIDHSYSLVDTPDDPDHRVDHQERVLRLDALLDLLQLLHQRLVDRQAARPLEIDAIFLQPIEAADQGEEHAAAAALADAAFNRSFLDPLLSRGYPEPLAGMLDPYVESGDMALIAQPLDVLGVNYYTRLRVMADPRGHAGLALADPPAGAQVTGMGWEVVEDGLMQVLTMLRDEYGDPPVVVTECGAAYEDVPNRDGRVEDVERARFIVGHLRTTLAARAAGCDVRGYLVWTLVDNLEWVEGFDQRFGIVRLERPSMRRTPKLSYDVLARIARTGEVPPVDAFSELV